MAARTTCGNVDSQSIARCGSSISPASTRHADDGRRRGPGSAIRRSVPRPTSSRRVPPRAREVLDVLPLVLDVLAECREGIERFEGARRSRHRSVSGMSWIGLDGRHARRLARGHRSPPEGPAARPIVAGDRSVGAADQPEETAPAGLVPGSRIRLRCGHPNPAGLRSFADLLQGGDAIEDVAVETGQIVGGRRGRLSTAIRSGGLGNPEFPSRSTVHAGIDPWNSRLVRPVASDGPTSRGDGCANRRASVAGEPPTTKPSNLPVPGIRTADTPSTIAPGGPVRSRCSIRSSSAPAPPRRLGRSRRARSRPSRPDRGGAPHGRRSSGTRRPGRGRGRRPRGGRVRPLRRPRPRAAARRGAGRRARAPG